MHTPHDAFFRKIFGHPRRLAALLASILPRAAVDDLELPALELLPPRRVTRALRGHESDLVARVPFRGGGESLEVQVVVEHQSSSPLVMALRLAAYATQQMLDAARAGAGRRPVPPVVCVVIYTGVGPWTAPRRLHLHGPPRVRPSRLLVDDLGALSRRSTRARWTWSGRSRSVRSATSARMRRSSRWCATCSG